MKKIIIYVVIIIITFIVYKISIHQKTLLGDTNSSSNIETLSEFMNEGEKTSVNSSMLSQKILQNKNIDNFFVETDNQLESQVFFEQFNSLNKNSFSNSTAFTSSYLNNSGVVSKGALEDTFLSKDFNEFIERVKGIEPSNEASLRASLLADKLHSIKDINIHSSNYSCAGKICVISFNYASENDTVIDELSNFSTNYTFTNIIKNEDGSNVFKGVYIETDDPSSLRVN